MSKLDSFDTVVVGGGPAGATAATDLARAGLHALLLDRDGRIKPCGGAIPPRAIADFDIPDSMLVARITAAEIVSPSGRQVGMPIDGGYVGMVDRGAFDPWLRNRAAMAGAERRTGTFDHLEHARDGAAIVHYRERDADGRETKKAVRARTVIGADGARSAVARQSVPGGDQVPCVFAYHEIVASPPDGTGHFDAARCDVHYRGSVSPDFYGWVFPHGATTSVGVGSANKGFSLRQATARLRRDVGLEDCETIRHEGAPIPLKPLARWDDGRNVVLAGDAAGVVAPASGEGIYYAMTGGRLAAEAAMAACRTGDARALAEARRRFMAAHGQVFWVLGLMQKYWYANDNRRERFVAICRDRDVQRLTWDAYMNKRLVRSSPLAHMRIFWKNVAHLTGVVRA